MRASHTPTCSSSAHPSASPAQCSHGAPTSPWPPQVNLLHSTAVFVRTIFGGTWLEPANLCYYAAILPSELAGLLLHIYQSPKYIEVQGLAWWRHSLPAQLSQRWHTDLAARTEAARTSH